MTFNSRNRNVRLNTFTDIPSQFPAIYREDGPLFVDFVESYYEYMDTLENDFRDAYNIRDIDTTYDEFLIYFKEKYLKDIPLDTVVDTRFIVKHIQDLYRRKGSEESLRLLFKLFFDEEIEVFYPSNSILKPSDSKYGSSNYIEMSPVESFRGYPIRKGDNLFGDISKATAFVDEIVFRNFDGALVPIIYLSNLTGSFSRDDSLVVNGQRINEQGVSVETTIRPGRLIRGSVNNAVVLQNVRRAGNRIGDIVSLRSLETGVGAKAAVTSITDTVTGVVKFTINEGGFGYTANNADNNITLSNQVVIVSANGISFDELDVISASNAQVTSISGVDDSNYANNYVTGTAEVIGFNSNQNVLFLFADDANTSFSDLPAGGKVTLTNETSNTTFEVTNIAPYNATASFEIGSLKNTETIIIITDIIGDYVNTALDSSDYGMTGVGAETLSTTIQDAFLPTEFTIGEIDTIRVLDEGQAYLNDVDSTIIQPDIKKFDQRDIGIVFDRIDFILQEGDIITQNYEIEDLTYVANTVPYTAKASFLRREGNVFYFRPKSFFGIDNDFQVDIRNNLYDIVSLFEVQDSDAMGNNADITGRAEFELGQIETVNIIDTGFRYRDGEQVELIDSNGFVAAQAIISAAGPGFTQGRWTTTTSFLNERTKVIHDNNYYQEYSYDISTIVNPSQYEKLTGDIVQVAGTKQFNSPLINSDNDLQSDVDVSFEVYDLITIANTVFETLDVATTNLIDAQIGN